MNMLLNACFAATLLGVASGALAAPTIELKDGSRIQGEIQGVENGAYIVQSSSLGTVHVPQSNIVRIVYSDDAANAPASSNPSSARNDGLAREIQQLQSSMVQDPATVQSIMSLQSDPQIQAILNDPAILKAVQEGDYASLLGNAKIQALESNEHLKQLLQQQTR